MLYAFVAVGGWIFWGVVAAWLLGTLVCVSKGKTILSLGTLLAFAAIMVLFTSLNIVGFVVAGWKVILMWAGIYLLVGMAWACLRWVFYAIKRKDYFYACRDEWHDSIIPSKPNDIKQWTEAERREFFSHFSSRWNNGIFGSYENSIRWSPPINREGISTAQMGTDVLNAVVPKARNFKSVIALWFAWWPFSVVSYLCEDFFTGLCKEIVKIISQAITAINGLIFKNMRKDLGV